MRRSTSFFAFPFPAPLSQCEPRNVTVTPGQEAEVWEWEREGGKLSSAKEMELLAAWEAITGRKRADHRHRKLSRVWVEMRAARDAKSSFDT